MYKMDLTPSAIRTPPLLPPKILMFSTVTMQQKCDTIMATKVNGITVMSNVAPQLKFWETTGARTIRPVPYDRDINAIMKEGKPLYLYNPFFPGLSLKEVMPHSLTYRSISNALVLLSKTPPDGVRRGGVTADSLKMLGALSVAVWPTMSEMIARQMILPKRRSRFPDVSPDMPLMLTPPTRRPPPPKMPKPGAPKPR